MPEIFSPYGVAIYSPLCYDYINAATKGQNKMTTKYYAENGKRIPADFVNTFRANGGKVTEVTETTTNPYESGKVATKGTGKVVHAVKPTGENGYYAACGGSTGQARLSQGRRVNPLRISTGTLADVTCKRCLANI